MTMGILTEECVSFEIAKLLKEKGFDGYPLFRYDDCGYLWVKGGYDKTNKWHFPAPTHQMAMKWLREIYQIDIQVFRHIRGKKVTFYARIEQNTHLEHQDKCNLYQSYEEACEAAIKYCLENLI